MNSTRIGQILLQDGTVTFPGVFDPLSALIAEQAGFPLAFVSGYSVAATMLGEPDMGLLTQTEMIHRASHICRRVTIPILVDADTGYGNPLNVYRTVQELIQAGAAGCFLEDQVWPKRCGHMQGKQVIPVNDFVQKIRAAVDAKSGRDFFIVARTDALAINGMDAAIERVSAAREAGADASFVEAPSSLQQLAEIGSRSPRPNVANMIEGGRTPLLAKEQLKELGFDLVLYPLAGLFGATRAIQDIYRELKSSGTTSGHDHQLVSFSEVNQLIGADMRNDLAERFESAVGGPAST